MDVTRGGAQRGGHDEDGHEGARDLLYAYAAAVALGQPAERRFPQVMRHLAGCVACQAELASLLEAIEPAYDGSAEMGDLPPALDLSFLPAARGGAPQEPWGRRALGRLLIVLDRQLDALRGQRPLGYQGPALLRARGAPLIDYEPDPATTGGASVSIQIYPGEADAQRCDVQIALILPVGVSAPHGIALTLSVDDQVWEETIDESGMFIFLSAVPVDARSVQIAAEILP